MNKKDVLITEVFRSNNSDESKLLCQKNFIIAFDALKKKFEKMYIA